MIRNLCHDRRVRRSVGIATGVVLAHGLYAWSRHHHVAALVLATLVAFAVLVALTRARGWVAAVLLVFAIEIGHVVTRSTHYPFSNVGMYSWVEPKLKVHEAQVVLLDTMGRVVPQRAVIGSGLDAMEVKILAKLLKDSRSEVDTLLHRRYRFVRDRRVIDQHDRIR
jgi:hypothetical protein